MKHRMVEERKHLKRIMGQCPVIKLKALPRLTAERLNFEGLALGDDVLEGHRYEKIVQLWAYSALTVMLKTSAKERT